MKKNLFYYSEKKLKYIEIKKFYSKFVSLIILCSIVFALLFLGGYVFITDILYPEANIVNLREENNNLKEKFVELSTQVSKIYSDLENLSSKENELRLSVNLDPLSDEEKNIGIGGSDLNIIEPTTVSEINDLVHKVDYSINFLESKVILAKNNFARIEESRDDNLELFKRIPALLPTDGRIGDRFGMRMHPILRIRRMHTGLDIIVNTGASVYSPGDGRVTKVGNRGGYGLTVEIDHGFGYVTLYAHLSKSKVKKGQLVKRGELIALSGKSGRLATGPHLHYEVKHNGVLLNPKNFMFSDIKIFDLHTKKGLN